MDKKESTCDQMRVLVNQHYPMRLAKTLIFLVYAFRFFVRTIIGRRRRAIYFPRRSGKLKDKTSWYDFAFLRRIPFDHAMIRQWVNHEPEVTALIKTLKGQTYIDVGCNTCYFPMLVQRNFKEIIGFEADPEIALWGYKNVHIPHLKIHNLAVCDHSEGVFLHRNPMSLYGGASIVRSSKWQGVVVESITLDEYLGGFNNRRDGVDLVKMDIEGAEWMALKGAEKVMGKIRAWIIELHEPSRKQELENLMKGYGYKTRWLDDYNLHDGRVIWNPHLYAYR